MLPCLPKEPSIYCIRNLASGRIYVGSSVNVHERWLTHINALKKNAHHSVKLQSSWNKHGASSFSIEILEIVYDRSLLLGREQYWIDRLHATCPKRGYNIQNIAESSLDYIQNRIRQIFSDERRARISAAKKGKKLGPQTAEHRANMSAAITAILTPETRAKMSDSQKKRRLNERDFTCA